MCYKKFIVAQAIVVVYYCFLMVLGYYLGSSHASPSIGPMLRGCFKRVNITITEDLELEIVESSSRTPTPTGMDEDEPVTDDDGYSFDMADTKVGGTNESMEGSDMMPSISEN